MIGPLTQESLGIKTKCKTCGHEKCRCEDLERAWTVAREGQHNPYYKDKTIYRGRRVPRHQTLDEIERNQK